MAVAICSPRALLSARMLASWLVNHLQDHSRISGVIFGYADPWVFSAKEVCLVGFLILVIDWGGIGRAEMISKWSL